jgi:predicted amidohydrolase
MLRAATVLLCMSACVSPALAQERYRSSDNEIYVLACNSSGYKLTSASRDVIYLGKSCDAKSGAVSDGSWCQANGGFRIVLSNTIIGFPRQGPRCSRAALNIEGCLC